MIYLIIICVVVAIVLVKKHQNSKLNNSQYSTLFKENTKAADIKPREIQKDKLINITNGGLLDMFPREEILPLLTK